MSLDAVCFYEEAYGRRFNFDGRFLTPEAVGEIIAETLMKKSEKTELGYGYGFFTANYLLEMLRSTGRYGEFLDGYERIQGRPGGHNEPRNARSAGFPNRWFRPREPRRHPMEGEVTIRYVSERGLFQFEDVLLSDREIGHIIARTLMDGRRDTLESDGCLGVTWYFLVQMLRITGKRGRFVADADFLKATGVRGTCLRPPTDLDDWIE